MGVYVIVYIWVCDFVFSVCEYVLGSVFVGVTTHGSVWFWV